MNKQVTVNGNLVTVKIEVRSTDKYNHILTLDDVEHHVRTVTVDGPDGEAFSHYVYKDEKMINEKGKIINTDKGVVEYILNKPS